MNERINELFDKALDDVVPNTWTNLTMDQLNDIKNKFAELIVEDCASLFPMQFTDEQYQRRIDKTIKKHFGLSE